MSATYQVMDLLHTIFMIRVMAMDGDAGDGMRPWEENAKDALHSIIDICNKVLEDKEDG